MPPVAIRGASLHVRVRRRECDVAGYAYDFIYRREVTHGVHMILYAPDDSCLPRLSPSSRSLWRLALGSSSHISLMGCPVYYWFLKLEAMCSAPFLRVLAGFLAEPYTRYMGLVPVQW